MIQTQKQILQFSLFRQFEELIHGMSTRQGGVSQGVYSSLNMGFGLGDEEEKVFKNYQIFAELLGFPVSCYTLSDQIHQAQIVEIKKSDRGNGIAFAKKEALKGVDALITQERDIALTIFSADCVPLLFYDAKQEVIAAAHSGWRGTVKDIAGKTIEKMHSLYGCEPKNIYVGIGPCISRANFEVGRDVKKEFEKLGKYDILDEVFQPKGKDKYLLDLRAYIAYGLKARGIEQMEVSSECTYGQYELFYSHRRDALNRGSHISVIYLKP